MRLERVHQLGSEDEEVVAQQWDVTPAQERALRTALEAGYFSVPRETTASDVAEELGISKSAFLERLHRAERSMFRRYSREPMHPLFGWSRKPRVRTRREDGTVVLSDIHEHRRKIHTSSLKLILASLPNIPSQPEIILLALGESFHLASRISSGRGGDYRICYGLFPARVIPLLILDDADPFES